MSTQNSIPRLGNRRCANIVVCHLEALGATGLVGGQKANEPLGKVIVAEKSLTRAFSIRNTWSDLHIALSLQHTRSVLQLAL